jgi:ethanolamine transporter EutH
VFGHNVEFGAVSVFRSVAVVVLAVTLVVIGLRAITHAQDRRFVVLSAGQALLAVIVLSPAFHGWYLLWALPFFAATVTQRRCHTVLAAVASVLAVANLPGGFSLALDTSWVGVPLCFVTVSGLAVAGWRWARGLRRRPPLPGPTPDSD